MPKFHWHCAAVLVLSIGLLGSAMAQGTLGQGKPAKPKVVAPQDGPVTKGEVAETFRRMRQIASRVMFRKKLSLPVGTANGQVASRADVIAQMDAMFDWLKPQFKFSPKPFTYRKEVLTIPSGTAQRKTLEKLLAYGCIDKFGPIAAGKKDNLTLEEFGDAVGFFMARICDLTHTPSAKFSPALMNAG